MFRLIKVQTEPTERENERGVRAHHDYEDRPVFRDESGNEGRCARRERRAECELPGLWNLLWRALQTEGRRLTRRLRQEFQRGEKQIGWQSSNINDSSVDAGINGILNRAATVTPTRIFLLVLVGSRFCAAIDRRDPTGRLNETIPRRQRIKERQQHG